MPNNELFAEFPPVSKADWLQQVAKDLKNTSLESLEWEIHPGLTASPFIHREDFSHAPSPLWAASKGWEICEQVTVTDPVLANQQALEALNGGAEALQFDFDQAPEWSVFEQTLANVHLDFIGLHFSGKGISQNPAAVFGQLQRLATTAGIDPKSLRGSVTYDPIPARGIIDWRYLADLMAFAQETFPSFKIISVEYFTLENPAEALAATVQIAHEYLVKLHERGISPQQTASFLQLSVPVGKSYFLEMAKIRALKLLWINVLKGWKLPVAYPTVVARLQPEAYTDDLYSNMIRSTTMAMSAVMGGADRLTLLPYDAGREAQAKYPAAFGRRIARNVQHLLKMESHLDETMDPAAGSYYIENLTELLAQKAWNSFTQPA